MISTVQLVSMVSLAIAPAVHAAAAADMARIVPTADVTNAEAPPANATAREERGLTPFRPCSICRIFIGIGGTYQLWGWSDGIVVPLTLELDESRWELGAFRMARKQIATGYGPPDKLAAEPYWGFTAMRRWQFLHRSWGRLYFGVGAVYRTESDYLDPVRWNFAYVLAARFDVKAGLLELAVRHWSDAWIKQPNRGQDFVTISVSF